MADSKEVYDFKKQIAELEKYRGRGTELISVYITPGYPISDIAAKLRDEYGQASNIKSKTTRSNVQAAIEKILAFLKTVSKAPENGIAVFAGNISEVEGKSDVRLFYVVPPSPLHVQFYRCESTFVVEPLKEMLEQAGAYGLVVMDGKEATVGLLRGKDIQVLRKLTSTAHQKVSKGGQCIHQDELIQFADGRIRPIKEVKEGDVIIGVDLTSGATRPARVTRVFQRNSEDYLELKVKNPIRQIRVTPEHRFFVVTSKGMEEKTAEELVKGDRLLFAKEIEVETAHYKAPCIAPNAGQQLMRLEFLEPQTAQFLGYFLGNGSVERNRVSLFDASEEAIREYTTAAAKILKARKPCVRHIIEKGYYEGRAHSLEGVTKLKTMFPTVFVHGLRRKIPAEIETADSAVVAAFLRGLFDAEGSVSSGRIALAMANKEVVERLPFLLSRFGIIASCYPKKARYKPQFAIEINDVESLHKFKALIGLSNPDKKKALEQLCDKKSVRNYCDQLPIDGRRVDVLLQKIRMSRRYVDAASMFLQGKRQISFKVFQKQIIEKVENRLEALLALDTQNEPLKKIRKQLEFELTPLSRTSGVSRAAINHTENNNYWGKDFSKQIRLALEKERIKLIKETEEALVELKRIMQSKCITATLVRKTKGKSEDNSKYIDLTLPETQNFVVNGFCVHNSAARFGRIHEETVEKYYKRVGEAMDSFLGVNGFKGVIVGGPGPAKEDFMRLKPFNYQLKVLGVVDTGYTDEYGLRELLEKSSDVIADQEAVREKKLLDKFMREVVKGGLAAYGLDDIREALAARKVELLLVSEGLALKEFKLKCPACGARFTRVAEKPPEEECSCGGKPVVESESDVVGEIVSAAEAQGVPIEMVSQNTAEGAQFHATFKGLGAFLRYK